MVAVYEPDAGMRATAKQRLPNAVFVDSLDALLQVNWNAIVVRAPTTAVLQRG